MGTNDTPRDNLETINLHYRALGHGGPCGVHLDPAIEGKGCEEERTETACQQLLAHLVLVSTTMGFLFEDLCLFGDLWDPPH